MAIGSENSSTIGVRPGLSERDKHRSGSRHSSCRVQLFATSVAPQGRLTRFKMRFTRKAPGWRDRAGRNGLFESSDPISEHLNRCPLTSESGRRCVAVIYLAPWLLCRFDFAVRAISMSRRIASELGMVCPSAVGHPFFCGPFRSRKLLLRVGRARCHNFGRIKVLSNVPETYSADHPCDIYLYGLWNS